MAWTFDLFPEKISVAKWTPIVGAHVGHCIDLAIHVAQGHVLFLQFDDSNPPRRNVTHFCSFHKGHLSPPRRS
jgi:hypothetical protein